MAVSRSRPAFGALVYFVVAFALALYFTFAAVQGDFGLLRRAEVDAEVRTLEAELQVMDAQVVRMENLTHRLSDSFLDLDLLDHQARDILGMVRADEIVVR